MRWKLDRVQVKVPDFEVVARVESAERCAAGETMAELAAEHECGEATIWRAVIVLDPLTDI